MLATTMLLRLFNKLLMAASAFDEVLAKTDCELDAIRSMNNDEVNDSMRMRRRCRCGKIECTG
jgi:hypothetical protein